MAGAGERRRGKGCGWAPALVAAGRWCMVAGH